MAMNIRKTSETASKMTLEWDPVPGAAAGYRGRDVTISKWTQTQQPKMTFAKGASVEIQALGIADSGAYPPVAPPPPGYTHRFATFDAATDRITGTLNRFNWPENAYWWVPGAPEPSGKTWPKGGGIFPISTPHGPGFRLVCDPDMVYQGAGDTRVCRFVADPKDLGLPFVGKTHVWEWTWRWPASGNPNGWAQALIEGFVTGNIYNGTASVGPHLFLQATSGGGLTYYMGRQTGIGSYQQFPSNRTFPPDTFHHLKFETRYSSGPDGFMRAYTDNVRWANYEGPTVPSSWSMYGQMFDIRPPLGGPLNTLDWINHRLTIL